MNNVSSLSRRAKSAYDRLLELCHVVNASPSLSTNLLPTALKELGVVSEVLEIAIQELDQQNQRLLLLQNEIVIERQRYQDFFEFVPNGCIVTDQQLTIQEVNQAAATLINTYPQNLVGKSFVHWIHSDDLPLLRAKLSQIDCRDRLDICLRLSRRSNGPNIPFFVALNIQVVRKSQGEILSLHWFLQDVTERKRAEAALGNPKYDPTSDRLLVHYSKGETIPFEPQAVWLVSEGVVKLTTMSDRGEEMLVGLMGDSMVFGSSLTALNTYQAIALSNVKLALIPISEVTQSPQLAQALLSSLKQRLQQAESFLAIYGQIRVEERLTSLLTLLKQAIGQPVEQGTRLRARLTHQDFASACCTTRVTITRLLGKLQEEGKITQDSHNHLVLREW